MAIRNTQTIILARTKTSKGSARFVARVRGFAPFYTFTAVPLMTRDEVIMDLEQRLGHGTFPEVKHG